MVPDNAVYIIYIVKRTLQLTSNVTYFKYNKRNFSFFCKSLSNTLGIHRHLQSLSSHLRFTTSPRWIATRKSRKFPRARAAGDERGRRREKRKICSQLSLFKIIKGWYHLYVEERIKTKFFPLFYPRLLICIKLCLMPGSSLRDQAQALP